MTTQTRVMGAGRAGHTELALADLRSASSLPKHAERERQRPAGSVERILPRKNDAELIH